MGSDARSVREDTTRSAIHWTERYARRIRFTDIVVVVIVVFATQLLWLGTTTQLAGVGVEYWGVSIALAALWLIVLEMYGSRSSRVIGAGSDEYRVIFDASLRLFGITAIVSLLFQIDFSRGYLLIAFPVGTVLLLVTRWLWRQWLRRQRRNELFVSRAILIGSQRASNSVVEDLNRLSGTDLMLVGICITGDDDEVSEYNDVEHGGALPVMRTARDYVELMEQVNADTLVIASNEHLSPADINDISWQLTPGRHHLIMAPSLTNIAGPRLSVRPVAGLPLIHVETPKMEVRETILKRLFDVCGSLLILLILSPLFLLLSILVKLSSPGPVFYTQERIGRLGAPFQIRKFRTMRQDSDGMLAELLKAQGTDQSPLFKIRSDPRVTRVGAFLRKYSLDELPQLVNVLFGEMSLVGPRPQREGEVALYDEAAKRRLVVKPGMSGLWQVSGRSNLEWEDAIRLDLYYVENWSLTSDLAILFKTFREVISPTGAY
ncbi:sugar transferase [Paramicrobacterium chengjingii]|uniref:sugar transferase n=1 Tax=Paramicrobacterium chengjingii TaxID=2769067 RepID=UPI001421C69A|nr:sugar transferase [Microbacterium chengjingii]